MLVKIEEWNLFKKLTTNQTFFNIKEYKNYVKVQVITTKYYFEKEYNKKDEEFKEIKEWCKKNAYEVGGSLT